MVGCGRGEQADRSKYAEIRALIRAQEYDRADAALEEWAGANDSAEAWLLRGWRALATGQKKACAHAIARARRDPQPMPEELDRLEACFLAKTGNAREAESRLVQLLQSPNTPDPEVCEALVSLLLGSYRLRQASAVLNRWAEAYPSDARPYLFMTEIDTRTRAGPASAVEHFREAVARQPSLVAARAGLAGALLQANQFGDALREYNALIASQPDDPALLLGRARCLVALGQPDAAAIDLDKLLHASPDDVPALCERAAIDLTAGQAETALERLDHALSIDPFDAEVHFRRSTALDRLGRSNDARAASARSIQLRDDERALHLIQQQFNENPGDLELHLKIARWMFDHGKPEHGIRWAQTILARDPTHAQANLLLASYYASKGQPGLANFHRLQAQSSSPAIEDH